MSIHPTFYPFNIVTRTDDEDTIHSHSVARMLIAIILAGFENNKFRRCPSCPKSGDIDIYYSPDCKVINCPKCKRKLQTRNFAMDDTTIIVDDDKPIGVRNDIKRKIPIVDQMLTIISGFKNDTFTVGDVIKALPKATIDETMPQVFTRTMIHLEKSRFLGVTERGRGRRSTIYHKSSIFNSMIATRPKK